MKKVITVITVTILTLFSLVKIIDFNKPVTGYSLPRNMIFVESMFRTAPVNVFSTIKEESSILLAQQEAERQERLRQEQERIRQEEEAKKRMAKQTEQLYSAKTFKRDGVLHWGNYRWTWYSERVLSGGGLNIPGRYADENGYICDENNYICLASSTLAKGTVINTPLGKQGKIYDSGCAAGTVDVYVNW